MGCVLVPKLLSKGYEVVVFDLMIFGADGLPEHENLSVVEGDLRDVDFFRKQVRDVDTVIHLACISNDPSFELNPELSKSINYDCFEPMVKASKEEGVKRFIYASTSSVYGVSDAPEVDEEHALVPLTDYNKYKGLCEPLLLKYQSPEFTTVIIRPATVCGYSPRMRLDLTVNILTTHAVNNNKITVFGGQQKRPNIHIEDVTDMYVESLTWPQAVVDGNIFNAGYDNHRVIEIAEITRGVVGQGVEIVTTLSDDHRSYHISSEKIRRE